MMKPSPCEDRSIVEPSFHNRDGGITFTGPCRTVGTSSNSEIDLYSHVGVCCKFFQTMVNSGAENAVGTSLPIPRAIGFIYLG